MTNKKTLTVPLGNALRILVALNKDKNPFKQISIKLKYNKVKPER